MSEEFDREALFNDIDKIMAQQGYSTVTPPSAPIEVEASQDTMHVVPTMPSNLNDLVSQVTETGPKSEPIPEPEPEPVVPHKYKPDMPLATEMEPEGPEPVPASEAVSYFDPKAAVPARPEPKPEPKLQPAQEPVTETIMHPDTDVMVPDPENLPKFTTIEKPMDWKIEPDPVPKAKESAVKDDRPPVSYLEGAQSDGYGVENVAFGDISVGVETESVEFSVGHPLLRLLRNILICVAAALLLSILITKFVAHHTAVDGSSMETTLYDGDQLIVEQLSYYFHDPQRFDVIVFPISSEDNYIKRIIGLPGETVQIKDGQVYINGSLLTEDHYGVEQMDDPGIAADTIYLKEGEYFVLGDNRNASVDSRFQEVGLIKRENIKGRAWLRFYPFGSFGTVK